MMNDSITITQQSRGYGSVNCQNFLTLRLDSFDVCVLQRFDSNMRRVLSLGVQLDSNGTVAGGLRNPKNGGRTRQKLATLITHPQHGTPGFLGPLPTQLPEKKQIPQFILHLGGHFFSHF